MSSEDEVKLTEIAIEKYSNGDMNFEELARVIGYEEALTFHVSYEESKKWLTE
jgi:hypothetical protein